MFEYLAVQAQQDFRRISPDALALVDQAPTSAKEMEAKPAADDQPFSWTNETIEESHGFS